MFKHDILPYITQRLASCIAATARHHATNRELDQRLIAAMKFIGDHLRALAAGVMRQNSAAGG